MRRSLFVALTVTTVVLLAWGARPMESTATAYSQGDRPIETDGVDGVIIRGHVRARVSVGESLLRIDGVGASEIHESRNGTTLTFVRTPRGEAQVPTVVVHVARLRGVATSGDVDLVVDDRSVRPLFLDLAGHGIASVRGSVPLARTTTSGTVRADFSALRAYAIRVHAREHSRALFDGYEHLTIVAVDDARIGYRGPKPDRVTIRNRATVRRERP